MHPIGSQYSAFKPVLTRSIAKENLLEGLYCLGDKRPIETKTKEFAEAYFNEPEAKRSKI